MHTTPSDHVGACADVEVRKMDGFRSPYRFSPVSALLFLQSQPFLSSLEKFAVQLSPVYDSIQKYLQILRLSQALLQNL